MKISFYEITHKGDMINNEDTTGEASLNGVYCFTLADGLGGHENGEIASSLAVETALKVFTKTPRADKSVVKKAFEEVQQQLIDHQNGFGMKTTLVMMVTDGSKVIWGHIGDSRLYFFRNKELYMRTLDHSVPQALVAMGEIKQSRINHHPDRNKLLRVLGATDEDLRLEVSKGIDIHPGDVFLLCSDGFWEWADDRLMIKHLIKSETPEEWLKLIQAHVLGKGRRKKLDNLSAIAVFAKEEEE